MNCIIYGINLPNFSYKIIIFCFKLWKKSFFVPIKKSLKKSVEKFQKTTVKKWRNQVAQSSKRRRTQAQKSPHCFLDLSDFKRPKYPVCTKRSSRINCQGVLNAEKRAILQKNATIKRRAQRLRKKLCL